MQGVVASSLFHGPISLDDTPIFYCKERIAPFAFCCPGNLTSPITFRLRKVNKVKDAVPTLLSHPLFYVTILVVFGPCVKNPEDSFPKSPL